MTIADFMQKFAAIDAAKNWKPKKLVPVTKMPCTGKSVEYVIGNESFLAGQIYTRAAGSQGLGLDGDFCLLVCEDGSRPVPKPSAKDLQDKLDNMDLFEIACFEKSRIANAPKIEAKRETYFYGEGRYMGD